MEGTYSAVERRYLSDTSLAHRKEYSQFFTPWPVAEFMASWVASCRPKTFLDPAFGLGVFAEAMCHAALEPFCCTGVDLDGRILDAARQYFPGVELRQEDYLQGDWNARYDAILCNPPYRKFHHYANLDGIAALADRLGVRLSGLTNLYALFLLKSLHQLNPGGRCAYIVPSEFLNADYGREVKRYLLADGALRHLQVFDFEQNVFDGVLTTACVLLLERGERPWEEISIAAVHSVGDLSSFEENAVRYRRSELDPNLKWRRYYQAPRAEQFRNLVPFSTYGRAMRGLATGANTFFLLNEAKRQQWGISERFLRPCIARAADVPRTIFTMADFEQLRQAGKNVFLLDIQDEPDAAVRRYLEAGCAQGIPSRYLTSKRHPWYAMERRPTSPVWATVFNRHGLRFVRNKACVANLTTFHSVYFHPEAEPVADLLFRYWQTSVCQEIFDDNRREYGGGLRKFEPNDLNQAWVADVTSMPQELVQRIRQTESHAEHERLFRQYLDSVPLDKMGKNRMVKAFETPR